MPASDTDTFDFAATYVAEGYSGIAWRAEGWEEVADEDTVWAGYLARTGRILAHMVGDDRSFTFDPEDLQPIPEDDYCASCGQIGCTHDGRDRDES